LPDGSAGPMPAFPPDRISDEQARELYEYLVNWLGAPGNQGLYQQGPGAGPGYGMGPGGARRGGPGMGYGGQYGSRYGQQYPQPQKPLDEEQAKQEVEGYLKSRANPNLKLGKMEDKGDAYEAEILTKDGSLVDRILVNKKSGGMRSIY
jgi:hypothetical protein